MNSSPGGEYVSVQTIGMGTGSPLCIEDPDQVKMIFQAFEKTSTPFCPPKPKELEIAASIFTARALLGITSRSHSGSLNSKLMVGGKIP